VHTAVTVTNPPRTVGAKCDICIFVPREHPSTTSIAARSPLSLAPCAVVKKFGDDNANLQVLALACYGFTAILPLLLVVLARPPTPFLDAETLEFLMCASALGALAGFLWLHFGRTPGTERPKSRCSASDACRPSSAARPRCTAASTSG